MVAVTVLGDVQTEITGRIDAQFREVVEDLLVYAPLNVRVGGSGANFAIAATGLFDQVHLIGAVGDDVQGRWLRESLRGAGVVVHFHEVATAPTGLAIAVRDASTPGAGSRLLLVSPDNANHAFDPGHVEAYLGLFTQTDIFVTDGYALAAEPRRSAVLYALQIAADAGALTVVDLVPHDCYNSVSRAEALTWLRNVDAVIAEVPTITRLLGVDCPQSTIDLHAALTVIEPLQAALPGRSLLLRFGFDNIAESLVFRPGTKPVHRYTGYTNAGDLHGFGDRLTAHELARYFSFDRARPGGRVSLGI